jgi:hypothetical protein
MNIFYLSEDPIEAAQLHCDKHVVKMILESCQLLSTAHRIIDGKEVETKRNGRKYRFWELKDARESVLYKASHMNHPSAIWCRENSANYKWLHDMTVELCKEYTYRYGRTHLCQSSGLVNALHQIPLAIKSAVDCTLMPQAMPDECKMKDPVQGYRNYYNMKKAHFAKWKNRSIPDWFVPAT